MLPDLLQSPARFATAFDRGLESLLEDDGLGAFILVAANALFDPAVHAALRHRLANRFATHQARYRDLLGRGAPLPDADDDVLVFLKLACLALDGLPVTERRRVGRFEVQCNALRAFRPQRLSNQPFSGLQRPFNRDGFHFNKPFLTREQLWEGEIGGRPVALYYNKFPFVERHLLLIPARAAERPQWLTADDHTATWELTATLGTALPGFGVGYNSLGAGASVNHLHFQAFVRPQPLAVAANSAGYPAVYRRYGDPEAAWAAIAALHAAQTPYNVLYLPGSAFLFPRRPQDGRPATAWSAGLTWFEMAGGFATANRDHYLALTEGELAMALADASTPG